MKKHYQYPATTGHTIVSPVSLDYAMNTGGEIDISKISKADFRNINMIADPVLARGTKTFLEEQEWPDAETTMANAGQLDPNWENNACVLHNGTIYIRDGDTYETIDSVIANCDKDTLAIALRFIAKQAVFCRANVTTLTNAFSDLLCKMNGEAK